MDNLSAQTEAGLVRAANGPQEHGSRLAHNALSLTGNIGMALGSTAPTVTIAVALAALVAAGSFASPIAILICGLPMLAIAAAFRRLNRWRVNCGGSYAWGARAISPYYGFLTGWITILAYIIGMISVSLPIGSYVGSLFGSSNSWADAIVGFAVVVLTTVVAYLGIRLTACSQWILIGIQYVGVGILAIWCLVSVFSHNPHSVPFSWSWFSWSSMGGGSGFVSASLIAVYMYSGWDTGILVNEETADAREKPGQSVVTSVIVLALMYALLTFALQGAVHTKALEANDSNALSYIAAVVSGSALAKYMILAVALSAVGSTLASLVAGARVTFAMGSDGVLPRSLAVTDLRYKTPFLVTIILGVIAASGGWLYIFGSSPVQDSFDTIVSVDGLLFALLYALTGITSVMYYRKLAIRSVWNVIQLALFPLAATAFLVYIIVRSVGGLGGWGGKSLISLYVMLAIGAGVMLYARFKGTSDYFSLQRETDQREADILGKAGSAQDSSHQPFQLSTGDPTQRIPEVGTSRERISTNGGTRPHEPLRESVVARSTLWTLLATVIGALGSVIATALSFTQIPGKRSPVSFETTLIIIAGLIVLFGIGLLVFLLNRSFRARRLKRSEDRLTGSDLRAINLFVTRELELLSTLGEGGTK